MATETLAPDTIAAQTNLSGAVGDIDEPTGSPDANWLTASSNNVNTDCRVTFSTPTGSPTIGADLQSFVAIVRQFDEGQTGTPEGRLELWENGTLVRAGTDVNVGTGNTTLTLDWNANELATADGSLVECKFVGTKAGGSPSNRNTVDLGAIEWDVDYVGYTRDDLYARNWDKCLLDFGRLDTVHEVATGDDIAEDNDEVLYVKDLSSVEGNFDITTASERWLYDSVNGKIDAPSSQGKVHIQSSTERIINEGTYFFAYENDSTFTGGQFRFFRSSDTFTVLASRNGGSTAFNVNTDGEVLTDFTEIITPGLHVLVVTLEDFTTYSVLRVYHDSSTELGNRTTAAQESISFDIIGNTGATQWAKNDGIYIFGMTTDLYTSTQVGDLIDEVVDIVNAGPELWTAPVLGVTLNGG